jgi:hypothetical protein
MAVGKCNILEGVRLRFPVSGIEIVPYEVEAKDELGKWKYVRTDISLHAGEHIVETAKHNEPVLLEAGGNEIGRYLYRRDSVELADDRAFLNLEDVIKQWNDVYVTLDIDDGISILEAVRELFQAASNRTNDYGAITGIETQPGKNFAETNENSGFLEEVLGKLSSSTLWTNSSPAYDWEEVAVHDALKEIATDLGVAYTVNRAGKFVMGNNGFIKGMDNSLHVMTGDTAVDTMKLSEYNVTKSGKKIKSLGVKGKIITGKELKQVLRQEASFNPEDGANSGSEYAVANTAGSVELQPVAVVTVPDVDGKIDGLKQTQTKLLGPTTGAAVNDLFNQWGELITGNIKFNGGPSTPAGQEELAFMDPGDVIQVLGDDPVKQNTFDAAQNNMCGQPVFPGLFSVGSVAHDVTDSNGWITTVETSLLPPKWKTESYYVDRASDNSYETLQDFLEENPRNDF